MHDFSIRSAIDVIPAQVDNPQRIPGDCVFDPASVLVEGIDAEDARRGSLGDNGGCQQKSF